ncbi:MAG: hypothetical protein U1F68_21550, partial [Gammaproteobacteria bacterium]
MNLKLRKISLAVAASTLLISASAVVAQEKLYVQCGALGGPVRDSQGECVLAAGGSPLEKCGAPVTEAKQISISLAADANFDFDRSELKPGGKASLDKFVGDMAGVDV